eukprot:gene2089-1961_t
MDYLGTKTEAATKHLQQSKFLPEPNISPILKQEELYLETEQDEKEEINQLEQLESDKKIRENLKIQKLLKENRSFQIGTISKFRPYSVSLKPGIPKEELSKHYIKNYKKPRFDMEQIEKFCHKYIEAGVLRDILQEDDTDEIKFNSSFVVTTNSKGKTILAIDYSHLSKILFNQGTEFPSITLTLLFIDDDQSIAFGKMDCKDAFYLTEIEVSDGRSVYGISGMPMHYQTNLNTILSQNPNINEDALKKGIALLEVCNKNKIKLSESKISFYATSSIILGTMIVYQDGRLKLLIDTNKISGMRQWTTPTSLTKLQALIGLTQYFGNSLPHLVEDLLPFMMLLNSESSNGITRWKKLELTFPDWSKVFTIHSDASESTGGAVLTQRLDDELFSAKNALKKYDFYFHGRSFNLVLDAKTINTYPMDPRNFHELQHHQCNSINTMLSMLKYVYNAKFPNMKNRCQEYLKDYIMSMPTSYSGYQYVLNILDDFTRFCILIHLKNKDTLEVTTSLLWIMALEGVPTCLTSNNGGEFINTIIDSL